MTSPPATDPSVPEPRWAVLAFATVAFALAASLVASPRTALFWYIFPLFGLGCCYLVQFRTELAPRWKAAFAASAVLSAVALALEWPFSGHVLWNVLFIGHAWRTGKRRTAWMTLLLVSVLYLFAMKVAFQTRRDVVGAFISVAVALIALVALRAGGTAGSE